MWCKLLPLLHGFSLIMLYLKKYLFPICQWRYFSVTFYNFYHYAIHNYNYAAKSAAKSLQSCPTLCDPIDGSPPGPTVPGILQARTLEWVAISFSKAWKLKVEVKSLSRVWLLATDPIDSSLPGSSIHGIFQARVLEWVAIAFSIIHLK